MLPLLCLDLKYLIINVGCLAWIFLSWIIVIAWIWTKITLWPNWWCWLQFSFIMSKSLMKFPVNGWRKYKIESQLFHFYKRFFNIVRKFFNTTPQNGAYVEGRPYILGRKVTSIPFYRLPKRIQKQMIPHLKALI